MAKVIKIDKSKYVDLNKAKQPYLVHNTDLVLSLVYFVLL